MEFVNVREFRANASKVWQQLKREKEIVITMNGKPIAVLSPTDSGGVETTVAAIRAARATAAVTALQMESLRHGRDKMTLREINREIAAARRARRA